MKFFQTQKDHIRKAFYPDRYKAANIVSGIIHRGLSLPFSLFPIFLIPELLSLLDNSTLTGMGQITASITSAK